MLLAKYIQLKDILRCANSAFPLLYCLRFFENKPHIDWVVSFKARDLIITTYCAYLPVAALKYILCAR